MKPPRAGLAAATLTLTGWLTLGAPMLGSSASANTPLGWAEVSSVPVLHWLLLFAVPAALFVAITLMVMGPAWARGDRGAPQSTPERDGLESPRREHRELQS